MKRLMAFTFAAGIVAAIGCTAMTPQKKYTADTPPPLQKSADGHTELPATRISDSNRHPAEDINGDNYVDEARRLENKLGDEGRAMTKAGQ